MKSSFPGFYSPTNDEINDVWNSDKTLFVFDTNTLLYLYGYAIKTRKDFFSILSKIKDRIWIPYHVGLEYQRRRLSVVRDEKRVFKDIEKLLDSIETVFANDFPHLNLEKRLPSLHKRTDTLQHAVKKEVSAYRRALAKLDKKQPCVRGHDEIREVLDKLFDGKVGSVPESQDALDKIFEAGNKRYSEEYPPGYKDKNKKETYLHGGLEYQAKYGDYIIWTQILEKAKEQEIENVIFITDDSKEDWWYIVNSRGEKTIGPRAELREEITRESSVQTFDILNTSLFLDRGNSIFEVNVSAESISEARKVFHAVYLNNGVSEADKAVLAYQDSVLPKDFEYATDLANFLSKVNADIKFPADIELAKAIEASKAEQRVLTAKEAIKGIRALLDNKVQENNDDEN